MPVFTMLCGLPASGKSTFRARFTATFPDCVIVSSDDFIDAYASEHGKTYSEVFLDCVKDADKHCRAVFQDAIASDKDILVDRTNLNPKSRNSFLSQLPEYYTRVAYVFEVEPEVLTERLRERGARTGKHIGEGIIASMRQSYVRPTEAEFDLIEDII